MAQFKTIVEAVLRNSAGGELDRVEIEADVYGYFAIPPRWGFELSVGDVIAIEQRETEVV